MQKAETTEKTPKRVLKKVSARQIKTSDEDAGFVIEGKLIGTHQKPWVDKEGEEKTLHHMVVEDDNGERIKFLADAGLRMALEDAMVQPGDYFKAVKGEKTDIGRGRTLNQWDIFQFA